MTLQAPAIIGVRPGGFGASDMVTWLRGIGVRQVRIACGLIMFSYIFSHFFNHALGNISYATMEAWLWFHIWWWRIPIVNFTLYAAAATHLSLGLWALYQRRHFRYTAAEITQLVLGFSIPLLLASHFGAVRVARLRFRTAIQTNYATPLFAYWVPRPYMIAVQFVLLTVAWTHACIGLYFWLRLKPFFKWAGPILLAIAVLLPPLAMIGAHHGAREVIELAKQPQWRAQNLKPMPPPQRAVDRRHHAVLFSDRLPRRDRTGVRGARRAHVARTPPRHVHGVLSEPAGPRAEGHERPRSQPALQNSARQRLRRPRPVLDLPRSRRQRPQRLAAAVRTRGLRAGARRRQRRSLDPSRLSAAAADRRGGHSGAAAECRHRLRAQPAAHQHRRRALRRQHVRGHARLDHARRGAAAVRCRLPDQPVSSRRPRRR